VVLGAVEPATRLGAPTRDGGRGDVVVAVEVEGVADTEDERGIEKDDREVV
jgi:hypothetical protein